LDLLDSTTLFFQEIEYLNEDAVDLEEDGDLEDFEEDNDEGDEGSSGEGEEGDEEDDMEEPSTAGSSEEGKCNMKCKQNISKKHMKFAYLLCV
jgi:hypothetical protein